MTVSDLSEAQLIARIQSRLPAPPPWMTVGIGDDAAIVEQERNRAEVLTVDALVEGIHFDRRFTPPAAIGHRALAVNLSDLAAMGASPRLALVSMALPSTLPCADFDAMIEGLAAIGSRYAVHVAGGNLTRSPGPLMLDVTLCGTVKPRQALLRRGARAGDELYVTGALGGAAAGLQYLQSTASAPGGADARGGSDRAALEPCINRWLYPEPRVRVGSLLGRNRAATACIDLSDGLGDGVRQIGEASGVGAIVEERALPVDPAARVWFESRGTDAVQAAASGGDDYELLFTVRPRQKGRLAAAIRHGGAAITRIGVCTAAPEVVVRGADGVDRPLARGFSHFR